jgi:hypothetical protein
MAHFRTDTKFTTVNSIFTWSFMVEGGNGARVNRIRSRTKAAERPINMMIYMSSLQNPPSGPPINSL